MPTFEWDTAKAQSNLQKHGVTFELATNVFGDPLAVEYVDDSHAGEDRFKRIGRAGALLLTVVYTERGEDIRIISARRATRAERDEFYSENSQS
jgi:uncharacterized DUF497 family protein